MRPDPARAANPSGYGTRKVIVFICPPCGTTTKNESAFTSPDNTTSFPRPSVLSASISVMYSMSVLAYSGPPWNLGPGLVYTVHPSGHCCPVAVGPFSTLHLLRSKLNISCAPRQFCHTTPWLSIATPPEPGSGILSGGGM